MSDPDHQQAGGLARGLGWFSIALGVAQVTVPDVVSRVVGVRTTGATRGLVRAIGGRELLAGLGLLSGRAPRAFLWARVAGDGMDLALLGNALTSGPDTDRGRTGAALASVAGVTALDIVAATRRRRSRRPQEPSEPRERSAVKASSAITVNAAPDDLYARWRDLERLPSFMYHLASVQATGDRRSHWVAKAPAGTTVEWDAELTDDVPGRRIGWRSLEGASVANNGSVRFEPAPGGRGTEVHVVLEYSPPGGALGAVVAKLFGEEPNQQIGDDLRRFKQIVETGEIARSDGSPLGTRTQNQVDQRDAYPQPDDGARQGLQGVVA
jgi:uncharacterized membrane protein